MRRKADRTLKYLRSHSVEPARRNLTWVDMNRQNPPARGSSTVMVPDMDAFLAGTRGGKRGVPAGGEERSILLPLVVDYRTSITIDHWRAICLNVALEALAERRPFPRFFAELGVPLPLAPNQRAPRPGLSHKAIYMARDQTGANYDEYRESAEKYAERRAWLARAAELYPGGHRHEIVSYAAELEAEELAIRIAAIWVQFRGVVRSHEPPTAPAGHGIDLSFPSL